MAKKRKWRRGEQAALAREAGISPQHVNDILHRRRGVSYSRARVLRDASARVLGRRNEIPVLEWLLNRISEHPAFYGTPLED